MQVPITKTVVALPEQQQDIQIILQFKQGCVLSPLLFIPFMGHIYKLELNNNK
jgi:hypothetical protein